MRKNNKIITPKIYFPKEINKKEYSYWLLRTSPTALAHNDGLSVLSDALETSIINGSERNFFCEFNLINELNSLITSLNVSENVAKKEETIKAISSIEIPDYWVNDKFYYNPILGLGKRG